MPATLLKTTALGVVAASLMAACGSMTQGDSAASASGPPDPQMKQVLDELKALGAKPLHTLSVAQARSGPTPAEAVKQVLRKQGKSVEPMAVANIAEGTIEGPGGPIRMRLYFPQQTTQESAAKPVVLYIHGGGWVIADLDTYDATPRALANAADAIVVSTHYRQAPEHPFPAAHDDTWTAYLWVLAMAERFGGDPQRVAVAGESAGGNMAAAIALRARDERVQPPVHQLLVYPVVDAQLDSPSEAAYQNTAPLATPDLPWFYTKYLGPDSRSANPYFAIRSANVAGVAPATVITAEIDPLRSGGQAYAQQLKSAGVPVSSRNFDGVTHEFFGMGAVLDKARQAVEYGAGELKRGWSQPMR